jgi:hypothetical protein
LNEKIRNRTAQINTPHHRNHVPTHTLPSPFVQWGRQTGKQDGLVIFALALGQGFCENRKINPYS